MKRVVSVIGLGYVGLPVAVEFARKYRVIGYDINRERVAELKAGRDRNGEVGDAELRQANLVITDNACALSEADFHIVAVPTPIDSARRPELSALEIASIRVAGALKPGDVVVYESTVYPGLTEEFCIPLLEKHAEQYLRAGQDFRVGYSPERINPGDPERGFRNILKVVAGQDAQALDIIAEMYGSVVDAGVYRAPSIRVAEAAKVIENIQRDLNIALMNEFAMICHRMDIDTQEVLRAAGTKWNFLPFKPGLVGGHCIGVDPYYLTHRAQELGMNPEVILAGRRVNDGMGKWVAEQVVKTLVKAGHEPSRSWVTVLGLTFKEDCRDLRNSKVVDVIRELWQYGCRVQIHDPLVDDEVAKKFCGSKLDGFDDLRPAQAVVVAVAHRQFRALTQADLRQLMVPCDPVLFDLKGIYDTDGLKAEGVWVRRL